MTASPNENNLQRGDRTAACPDGRPGSLRAPAVPAPLPVKWSDALRLPLAFAGEDAVFSEENVWRITTQGMPPGDDVITLDLETIRQLETRRGGYTRATLAALG